MIGTLVDPCYWTLRDMIIAYELVPEVRYTIPQLMTQLGATRNAVRESLLRLSQDRLIDILPKSGFRVSRLTIESINDLLSMLVYFLPELIKRAGNRFTREQMKKLDLLIKDNSDISSAVIYNRLYYQWLTEATGSGIYAAVYNKLSADMDRLIMLVSKTPLFSSALPFDDGSYPHEIENAEQAAKLAEAKIRIAWKSIVAHLNDSHDVSVAVSLRGKSLNRLINE